MGITIIHLTDIHLKDKNNSIEEKIEALKKACCSPIINGQPVIIVVSGDIAFSGKDDEYKVATNLFKEISEYIEQQKSTEVHFIIVPGNHDCNFNVSSKARESLQSNINNNMDIDSSFTTILTDVQESFRNFCKEFNSPLNQDIITPWELIIGGEKILFLLVNTAWMSKLKEVPGKIIIPKNLFLDINIQNYKMVITAMHHPINWLDPDNAKDFRDYLRKSTDLLLVGHEHRSDEYITEGKNWSINERYGKELQNSWDPLDSSFVIYNFNNSFTTLNTFEFVWNNDELMYKRNSESEDFFSRNSIILNSIIYPNEATIRDINDVGIIINHFSADNISLSEIYLWPQLEELDLKSSSLYTVKINDNIPSRLMATNITLIYGDSLSGKTSLAKMMFLEFIKKEQCCLLLKGEDFTSFKQPKLNETIEKFFYKQYSADKIEKFRQLPKESKSIIIDNFNNLKYHDEKRDKILKFLSDMFDNVIILFDTEMDMPVLYSKLENGDYGTIQGYKISYMGNSKRKEFIKKWYSLRESNVYNPEKQNIIESMIDHVNNFLGNGKKFIPAVPIVMINVLQNSDSFEPKNFTGSQYGFLYESLIYKNLSAISKEYKNPGAINIDISILASLSFDMLCNSRTYFTKNELYNIVEVFKREKMLDADANSLIDKMTRAKIIYEDIPNLYKYRYPYIFYYFSGRYIAYNMDKTHVKEKVEYMSSRLYNEQYSNIIIFVCHFANSIEIIETILLNAYVTLDNYETFNFDNSNDIFANAQSLINKILIPENLENDSNVEQNKEKSLSSMDDVGIQDGSVHEMDDDISDDISDKERELASITSSIKTMEVLGQILQNYPGDIDGNVKIDIIDEVHELGMRLINVIIINLFEFEKELINYLINKTKEDKRNYGQDQIAIATRDFLCVLLAGMIKGIISKVAMSMSSEHLLLALKEAFRTDVSISRSLILQEIKFNYLRTPDIGEAFELFDNLEKINNRFALSILKSIVGNYLKYNKCDAKMRNKICDRFGFNNEIMFLEGTKNIIT